MRATGPGRTAGPPRTVGAELGRGTKSVGPCDLIPVSDRHLDREDLPPAPSAGRAAPTDPR